MRTRVLVRHVAAGLNFNAIVLVLAPNYSLSEKIPFGPPIN